MREKSGFLSFCHVLTVLRASFFFFLFGPHDTLPCVLYTYVVDYDRVK